MRERFQDQPVVFIGLTPEGEQSLRGIERFIAGTGAAWLHGYGARQTLLALRAERVPLTWVIGPDGRIVWNADSEDDLADSIQQALELVETVDRTHVGPE